MAKFVKKVRHGFTLVEIMIVVLIIGILLAIAVPNFIKARESSRTKACIANLKQIDSAKEQWAMDKNKANGATVSLATACPPVKRNTRPPKSWKVRSAPLRAASEVNGLNAPTTY